ncbi:MAG: BON domain-containing protein [Gammaproteobacteria bacterium]|nr:BON domain-containing protein [Gammaproteobacteria bacterium]
MPAGSADARVLTTAADASFRRSQPGRRNDETRAKKALRDAHPDLEDAHLSVTSFNGVVLLTGQVPSEEAKEVASKTVGELRHVKTLHNELQVAGPTSMVARYNDGWLSTKVKTALVTDEAIEGSRVKVVTEDGVVYLMGLMTRNEADAIVEKARQVFGVQKIVKAFEYIN